MNPCSCYLQGLSVKLRGHEGWQELRKQQNEIEMCVLPRGRSVALTVPTVVRLMREELYILIPTSQIRKQGLTAGARTCTQILQVHTEACTLSTALTCLPGLEGVNGTVVLTPVCVPLRPPPCAPSPRTGDGS